MVLLCHRKAGISWPGAVAAMLLIVLFVLSTPSTTTAKVISGDFKLSGVNSEKVLTSFAVMPEYGAKFQLRLKASDMYETERYLKLRLFQDEKWNSHLRVMTCQEKIRHASHSIDIVFDYIDKQWQLKEPIYDVILTKAQKDKYDPRKVMRNKRKREQELAAAAAAAEEKDGGAPPPPEQQQDTYVDDAFVSLEERDLIGSTKAFTADRVQYWYLTLDDCMLEQTNLDGKMPMLHFDLEIVNALEPIEAMDESKLKLSPVERQRRGRQKKPRVTHLSADETNLVRLHTMTLLISGMVAAFLVFNAGMQSTKGGHTVHAAVLWVALAAALDATSSFCAIIHLNAYDSNGYGSYFMDAMAAHLEALCDSFLILLLLSIGAGWTLPSDAIRVRPNENALHQAFTDLASPLRAVLQPSTSVVGMFAWGIIGTHVILVQWGRTYNDDFESYHDFAHLPGKILMFIRIVLGLLLLAVTMRTHLQAKVKQLQDFYLKMAILGFLWFQSLPFVTWACNTFVPYYRQHPTVFLWSAILQASSIILLAALVTSHSQSSAFAQYSHATAPSGASSSGASSLGESLSNLGGGSSAKSSFMFGKTKIAVD